MSPFHDQRQLHPSSSGVPETSCVQDTDELQYKCFKLLQYIGKGTYGKVYKVAPPDNHHDKLFQTVQYAAMKVVEWRNIQSARREVIVHMRVSDSPYIATFYRYFEDGAKSITLMEHVQGQSVGDVDCIFNCFGEKDILKVTWELLSAIHHMHKKSIVHRDIKLGNMIFTSMTDVRRQIPSIRLVDFGLSKEFCDSDGRSLDVYGRICEGGTSIGTPGYCAPEMENIGSFSPGYADMWSVGVVLYTLLTGQLPYDGGSFGSITDHAYDKDPDYEVQNLKSVSRKTKELLQRLLSIEPEYRPTARVALEVITSILKR